MSEKIETLNSRSKGIAVSRAAGTTRAAAVSRGGRGAPRPSQRTEREDQHGLDVDHVPLLDPLDELRGERGGLHHEDEGGRRNGQEGSFGRSRREAARAGEADHDDERAHRDERHGEADLGRMEHGPATDRPHGVVGARHD